MPITFGSVGDIISISLIVKDLVQALDDSRGSAAEYQDLIRELWALDRVLLEVEQVSRNSEQTNGLYALWVTTKRATDECRQCIENFLEKIKKYEKSLGGLASGHTLRGVPMKIRWRLTQSDELEKFRTAINAHCSSLSMLLIAVNLNVAQLNAKKLREAHTATEELQKNAVQKQNGLLEVLQSGVDRNTEVIKSHTKLIKHVMKLDWLRNLASDLKGLARKILFVNLATFRMVADLRASLPSHLDRCLIQELFLLEDAIGREAPVHLQFINSWDALYAVLEARFQNLQGYNKVKRKEFVLQERATRRDISHAGSWEGSFLPGQRVDMSITFTEIRQNVELACPRCQTTNRNCSGQSTQCAACGMWFTRVIELCDPDPLDILNPVSRTARTATAIKFNNPTIRIDRGATTPGPLERPVPDPKSHIQPELASWAEKRPLEDIEAVMQEEISSFKRVRMISRQFRENNGNPKTDGAPLSPMAADQEPNENASYPTEDAKIASSDTPSPPNSQVPLPRQGRSNNETEEVVEKDELSSPLSTGSMDVNFGSTSNYIWENGRRYHNHKGAIYCLPNDEKEKERLDLQHHLIGLVLDNNLFLAPLQNPKKILDQGTGTGIWSMDVADKYQDATVIGTDLSSIQPSSIPKNCYFEIDNINLPWTDQANSVDFVFSRFGNGFSDKNWDHYLSESFNCLAPGGWAEVQDMDFAAFLNDTSDPQDSMMNHWQQLICEGASNANINMRISSATLKTKFENAGFTNVQVVDKIIPMGKWPKDRKLAEIGMFQLANFLVGLEAFSLAILQRHLGWAYEEVTLYIYQLRKHVESGTLHWCWPFFVVYGQKPAND